MRVTVERQVISRGRRGDMRELRRRLYHERVTGWSDGDRYGLVLLDDHPVTLLYTDGDGWAVTADVALSDRAA